MSRRVDGHAPPMNDDAYLMEFGWDGDDGLGAELILQVVQGTKTATCCPETLFETGEIERLARHVGQRVPLVDSQGIRHGFVRLLEVERTTWGAPDIRLVRGEGYATADEFRRAHDGVWDDQLSSPLVPSSVLVVEYFEYLGLDSLPLDV